jgi:hypothetical protein
MKAKNINGTSDTTCACGSWLDHWMKVSGKALPQFCSEEKCIQKPEVGAHIQKEEMNDASWYIVPLCKAHNAEKGMSININNAVQLVPANISITCGKK